MTIFRDAWGIPHIRADSVAGLAHEQGLDAARDRAWQIELEHLRSLGATASALGPAGLSWDRFARRVLIDETVRLCFGRLDDETKAFCEAYVGGVNAGLADGAARSTEFARLGLEPRRWDPWTPLGIFLVQHILFASFPTKLWRRRVAASLGPEAVGLFGHEGPALSGSNAWAVGGARTTTGAPLIGGDPHRIIEAPGIYQQVHLSCPEFDVVGFAFPGVPGLPHFAHAGGVAWAITNAMADYQDLYVEQLRRSGDGVEALGPDGWYAAEFRHELIEVLGAESEPVEVIETRNGPVIIGGVGEPETLSLRTTAYVGRDLGFSTLLPLLRSKSVDDVSRALDGWIEPVNNVVIADRAGGVRYRIAGRVPVRDGDLWTGWVDDLPAEAIGPEGQVVTANERRGEESARIGFEFAPPHRAQRIAELLDGRSGLTVDDFAGIHADTLSGSALLLREFLGTLDRLAPPAARLRDEILAWDGRMEADSAAAGTFSAWRSAFVRNIAAQPAFESLRGPSPYTELFDPWLDLATRIGHGLANFIAHGSPLGLDLGSIASTSLLDVAAQLEAAAHTGTWGERHTFAPLDGFAQFGLEGPASVPALPLSGDSECVRSTSSTPGVTDVCFRGSVARYVWDLDDRANSRWIVPLGASGVPGDPHAHDQLEAWAACELIPVLTDWTQLTEEQS